MLIKLAYLIAAILITSISLSAQAFPMALRAIWDAGPPDQNTTHYIVSLDGIESDFPAVNCQVQCVYPFSIPNRGPHIFAVRAVNMWGTSDPASITFTAAPPDRVRIVSITK